MKLLLKALMLCQSFNIMASKIKIEEVKTYKKYSTFKGHIEDQDPIGVLGEIEAPFLYYKLKGEEKKPLVYVFPSVQNILGIKTKKPVIEDFMAKALLKKGYNVVIVELIEDIFDTTKHPRAIDQFFSRADYFFTKSNF